MIYFHERKFSSQNGYIVVPRIRYCMTCFNKQRKICVCQDRNPSRFFMISSTDRNHIVSSWASQSLYLPALEWTFKFGGSLSAICLHFIFFLLFNITLSLFSSKIFKSTLHYFQLSKDVCLLWKWQNFLMLFWNLCSIYLLQ